MGSPEQFSRPSMSHVDSKSASRPDADKVLVDIADYAAGYRIDSNLAYDTARYCLMDTLACGFQALADPACANLLGPLVPGATMAGGARVPGTSYELDPVRAAFNIGTMIRWLDLNDTWLAAERGHPSENLGGILAVADYCSRKAVAEGTSPMTVRDVLTGLIKAHEIQGVTALEIGGKRVGLDHVILVRVASTAVTTAMLGGNREQIISAVSNAWIDGGALRNYRHAPDTGWRKSWAAGDATSRGVWHALNALRGEKGYPLALSAPERDFYDVLFKEQPFVYRRGFGSYVMENALFKISFPGEIHAQTAVECAIQLHPGVRERLQDVSRIVIETQEAGRRIIDRTGTLGTPADRDRCIQYMTAVGLIFGRLRDEDYKDEVASDPRIDALRECMEVQENPAFTQEYCAADKRHVSNAVQVFFKDGSKTDRVQVDFPIGHRKRRAEGIPALLAKFESAVAEVFPAVQSGKVMAMFADPARLDAVPVNEFVAHLTRN
jgi:2-methylcitrate dehydratase